jgi:aminoglycoside phosphotransferase (APT) family kinase protein
MEVQEPNIQSVEQIANRYFKNILAVNRIKKGASTFVYKIITNESSYYIRFLPENDSFGTEVLAHKVLYDAGVRVPHIIDFDHKNNETGLSMMLIDEIPGASIEDDPPNANLIDILHDAGQQLALLHTIPVLGFGFIDKKAFNLLKGEKATFDEYFCEHIDSDIDSMNKYPFSADEKKSIEYYIGLARKSLNVQNAVLVHGDFDISHIFHSNNRYSGIIDFGEIRGNNRLFDLATFVGFYQDRISLSYLLEGYNESVKLTKEDTIKIELMALFMILRFLGKKENTKSREHWFQLIKKQLIETKLAA